MKYGVAVPNFGKFAGKENIKEVGIVAEELGYDSLWVSDHLVVPKGHKGFGNIFYDPIVTLSYLASLTNKIKLGTSVIVLPYRNPLVVAKEISTLDVLSGGRVIMGIGVGWLKAEFNALGVKYEERGQLTDEYLKVIKELYTSESPEFRGEHFNFSDIYFYPKPLQKPYPPVWIGGSSTNSIKRAVNYGIGWHAVGSIPNEIKEKSDVLNSFLTEKNKCKNDFVVSVRKNLQIINREISDERELLRGNIEKIVDGIDAYKKAGVSYIVFQILSSDFKGVIETMKNFSEKVIKGV